MRGKHFRHASSSAQATISPVFSIETRGHDQARFSPAGVFPGCLVLCVSVCVCSMGMILDSEGQPDVS